MSRTGIELRTCRWLVRCGIELATEESVDIDAVVGGIVEEPTGDASNIKFVHQVRQLVRILRPGLI